MTGGKGSGGLEHHKDNDNHGSHGHHRVVHDLPRLGRSMDDADHRQRRNRVRARIRDRLSSVPLFKEAKAIEFKIFTSLQSSDLQKSFTWTLCL